MEQQMSNPLQMNGRHKHWAHSICSPAELIKPFDDLIYCVREEERDRGEDHFLFAAVWPVRAIRVRVEQIMG